MNRLVTEAFPFDIRLLIRESRLAPCSTFEWVWRRNQGSLEAAVKVTVIEEALEVICGGALIPQTIRLTYSIGHQGGKRPWFLCPACQQQAAILYYQVGLPFRC